MSKHTPGPWKIEECVMQWFDSDRCFFIGDEMGVSIGLTPNAISSDEANAHLIAAAPDLLAACEEAYKVLYLESKSFENGQKQGFTRKVLNNLDKTIAKTKGA